MAVTEVSNNQEIKDIKEGNGTNYNVNGGRIATDCHMCTKVKVFFSLASAKAMSLLKKIGGGILIFG